MVYELVEVAGNVASVIAMVLAIPAAVALLRRRRRVHTPQQPRGPATYDGATPPSPPTQEPTAK